MIFFVWDEKRCGCRSDIPEYDYELIECLDAATIEKKRCKISDRDKGGYINKDKERSVNIFYLGRRKRGLGKIYISAQFGSRIQRPKRWQSS